MEIFSRQRGRPAATPVRHLVPIRHSWPRSSALRMCMTCTATSSRSWTHPFPPFLLSLAESVAAVESPLLSSLRQAQARSTLHRCPPKFTSSFAVFHSPPSPNRVAGTVFSGKLNAELLEASLPLWLGSLGSLGP